MSDDQYDEHRIRCHERLASLETKVSYVESRIGGIFNRLEEITVEQKEIPKKIFWAMIKGVSFPLVVAITIMSIRHLFNAA